MNKFYITTPIYYVNASPHIGHTYTTVAADVLARFHRLRGDETFFLTGTDEHGAKIEEKAREVGLEPQIFADGIAEQFRVAWQELGITNDRFIRTTEVGHKKAVQQALQAMYDKGDIYQGEYHGLYCRGCEQYKHDKDLVDGKCPDHQTVPEEMSEECYLFRMSAYQDRLLKLIKDDEFKIRPVEKKKEIISFYQNEGLKDVSFSRKNVSWGIPLPWDHTHTTYVWADAFLNYLTGLGWGGEGEAPIMWPADLQLMSKDILRVHATIWPAMLLSLNLPLPKQLFVHGFFLSDGQKMSKSLGNVIAPKELLQRYGVDATRYLLMSAAVFGRDGDISWSRFDEKYNADLANGLGNLVSRVFNLIEKNYGGGINRQGSSSQDLSVISQHLEQIKIYEAVEETRKAVEWANGYIEEKKLWQLVKDNSVEGEIILAQLLNLVIDLAKRFEPIMPTTSRKILSAAGGGKITKGEPLFLRV